MKRLTEILISIACLLLFTGLQETSAQNVRAFSVRGVDLSKSAGDKARYPSFTYSGYAPLSDRPIKVFYYIPTQGDVKEMPILFVLSGAQRVGNGELNPWYRIAEEYGIIVVNPQFTAKDYNENAYQFGNVSVSLRSEEINKKKKWIYNMVESLFDYYLKTTRSNVKGYYLFGHSAGGQFVGRMAMLHPEARYIKAVAANPSTWTWPEEDGLRDIDGNIYSWPYSVKNTPSASPKVLKQVLQRRLYIQIGTNDIKTKSLDRSAGANAQGARRYHRALNFYDACVAKAKELGVECGFRLAEVQGTRHSTLQAVYGYPDPDVEKIAESDLGVNSAFKLLFRSED